MNLRIKLVIAIAFCILISPKSVLADGEFCSQQLYGRTWNSVRIDMLNGLESAYFENNYNFRILVPAVSRFSSVSCVPPKLASTTHPFTVQFSNVDGGIFIIEGGSGDANVNTLAWDDSTKSWETSSSSGGWGINTAIGNHTIIDPEYCFDDLAASHQVIIAGGFSGPVIEDRYCGANFQVSESDAMPIRSFVSFNPPAPIPVSVPTLSWPFSRGSSWEVCQGYRTSEITHNDIRNGQLDLTYSLDLAFGINHAIGTFGCGGDPRATDGKRILSPAKGVIVERPGYTDLMCLRLTTPVSTRFGLNFINSMTIGHIDPNVARLEIGEPVEKGGLLGFACSIGSQCASFGNYAHVHITAHSDRRCGNKTGIPIGKAFPGFNFANDGTNHQWYGTKIRGAGSVPASSLLLSN